MDDFSSLLDNLKNKFEMNKTSYYPFIEYIRFPKYKLLEKNSRINFNFPITLLVGKNGTNKTSLLQALYGSPEGKSIGEYWFTTSVDKIDKYENKNEDRHCLIYGYYFEKAERIVEVLKTRVNIKRNLDYWEPSRPLKKYDMEILPEGEYLALGSSLKTRWDTIKKMLFIVIVKSMFLHMIYFFIIIIFKKQKDKIVNKILLGVDQNYCQKF